jgi:transcriptional regulator with XRE-family HTH domain
MSSPAANRRVERRRRDLGLSLDAVGARVGVSASSIRRWICGTKYPELGHREAFAAAIKWPLAVLEDALLALPVEPCGENGSEWAPRAAAAGAPAATD